MNFHDAENFFKRSNISSFNPFTLYCNLEVYKRNTRSVKDFHHNTSQENITVFSCPSQISCCESCVSGIKYSRRCECDSVCAFFNDCCSDCQHYQEIKEIKKPGKLEFSQLSCIITTLDNPIWVVTRCPANKVSNEISLKCENANKQSLGGSNVRTKIPVHGKNSLVYLNEYCAKCNGDYDIQHFVVNITCDILPPTSLTTINDKVMFALKYCRNDSIIFQPRNDYKTRRCFPDLVKDCFNANPYYDRRVKGPVKVVALNNGTIYRNKWCAVCAQHLHPTCGPCIHNIKHKVQRPIQKIIPLSFLLDTKNGYSTRVRVKCRNALFYDSKLQVCSRFNKAGKLPKTRNFEKFLVAIWFNSGKSTGRVSKKKIYSSLKNTFNISISQMNKFHLIKRSPKYYVIVLKVRLTPEQTLSLTKQGNDEMNSQKKIQSSTKGRKWSKRLPLKRLLFFTTEFNISIGKQTFTVFKTTYRQLTCITRQRYNSTQYIVLPNGSYYINSSGTTYEEWQVFFEDSVNQNISVCEQVVLPHCQGEQMSLKENEYVSFKNLSLFYNGTNKMYSFGEYDIQNRNVLICLSTSVKWRSIHQSTTEIILTFLTLTGLVLSLFGLILVILTYSIFSELRSVPGKNILNLSVSLFMAQFLWLTAVGQSSIPVLCHVTAIVEHYLFLVSFVAMAIIAYHTYLGFSSKKISRDSQRENENKKFLKYCIITWCAPAIFVGICFVLDQQSIFAIYSNDQVCWFENKQAQKYLFVLPVGVILFFNAIFFTLTVIHIHKERSDTILLSSSHTRPRQTMFWIYLKIATLMGFSWLFGFLDLVVHSTLVFKYLFVIFTSFQGVSIAIAFIMNKRTFKMYKDFMRKKLRCKLTELNDGVSGDPLKTSTKCTQL